MDKKYDPITLETVHKRKDGSTFPVEARAAVGNSGDIDLRPGAREVR